VEEVRVEKRCRGKEKRARSRSLRRTHLIVEIHTALDKVFVARLHVPERLQRHVSVFLRNRQRWIHIVRQPGIVGRDTTVVHGIGNVHSVRWWRLVVADFFGDTLCMCCSNQENQQEEQRADDGSWSDRKTTARHDFKFDSVRFVAWKEAELSFSG